MGKQRKTKNIDLTVGNITSSLWKFAVPLMLGNVLQQLYNLGVEPESVHYDNFGG